MITKLLMINILLIYILNYHAISIFIQYIQLRHLKDKLNVKILPKFQTFLPRFYRLVGLYHDRLSACHL